MPLSLQSFDLAIICDGNELEMYDVKQEGPNSITTAFVASEAGKRFSFTISNNLLDFALAIDLYIDGECVCKQFLRAGKQDRQILGIRKSTNSILPFKFQELELVDPDLEDAPDIPEIGTIELRVFRCRAVRQIEYKCEAMYGLHQGRVSERSKKAGWHHVSTSDEIFTNTPISIVKSNKFDPRDAPCASVKVFYRPRGEAFVPSRNTANALPELLMAQGVIVGCGVGAVISGGSEVNNRKRAREDGLFDPSKRRARSSTKKEEVSVNAHSQRIQALLGELDSLMDEQTGSSVKHELRTPSPIVVGQATGEVVDLTLED